MAEPVHDGKVERPSGDVSARTILAITGGWFVYLFVAVSIIAVIYYVTEPKPRPVDLGKFPNPELVNHPETENAKLVDAQKKALQSYGSVGPGFAHIPIGIAMKSDLNRADPYAPIAEG